MRRGAIGMLVLAIQAGCATLSGLSDLEEVPGDASTVGDTNADSVAVEDTAVDSLADTSTSETSVEDAKPDSVTTDVGADGATCGGDSQPCCAGGVCNAGYNCSGGKNCVRKFGCQNQADCILEESSLKCSGPSSCAGFPCWKCGGVTPGAKAANVACTDSTQCQSGLCDPRRDRCTVPCWSGTSGDTDCMSALGSGSVCVEEKVTSGTSSVLGLCAKRCARDADCDSGSFCQGVQNVSFNRIDFACGPPASGAAVGATCAASTDCASGICANLGGSKVCTTPCLSGTECPTALSKCTAVSLPKPTSGTQSAMLCTP